MKTLPSSYFNKNDSLGNTTELLGSVLPLKTARARILEGAKPHYLVLPKNASQKTSIQTKNKQ